MQHVVLAYGWYGRGNAGDELMKLALQELFRPRNVVLRFTNSIDMKDLKLASGGFVDGVIFGGGSILDGAPNVKAPALEALLTRKVPVFYMGVGPETAVDPVHASLLAVARVIAFRDKDIPDLVYSLSQPELHEPKPSVLIIPNIEVVPTTESPHWMHVAWEHYKNEMAQALDELVDNNVKPEFLLMCKNPRMDDAWPATELLSRMKRRPWEKIMHRAGDDLSTCTLMSRYRVVVTQRYHGIILAEIAGVPYVSLDHHDKLKNATPSRGRHLSYYGVYKAILKSAIEDAFEQGKIPPHVVPHEIYDELADRIVAHMGYSSP
jgi:hypothetical protein